MTEVLDLSLYAKPAADGTLAIDLAVEGISCGGCIGRIEGAVRRLPGVTEARLNFTNRRLHVAWDQAQINPSQILSTLETIGYHGYPFMPLRAEVEEAAEARRLLRYLAVAGFAAMNIMLLSVAVWSGNVSDITPETRDLFHWASALIALPAAAYAGQPFFVSAWRALRARSLNMNVPISLGVILALGMSVIETINHAADTYYDSAIMLLFFLLVGRTLEHAMRRKTRAVAGNLAALKGETAHRFIGGEVVSVPVAALKAGDRVLLRAGERVPADCVVLSGRSEIDESIITGETARRTIVAGATVYAGAINYSGTLILKVTATGGAALIDEIERLLEKASSAKSHAMRLVDRAARVYAPLVHATAVLTAIGWLMAGAGLHDAMVAAITVLIITCPCALALAIPAVQVVASGAMFRAGVILNAGDAVERLAEADTVIFDKTGTLTLPEPHVANATAIEPDVLQTAARLALSSRHPLAVALAHEAAARMPFEGAVEEPGQGVRTLIDGVEARLGSAMFCGVAEPTPPLGISTICFRHHERSAVVALSQTLRSDAAATLHALSGMGLDLHILSGDRADVVRPIALALGVAKWKGELKPAEKIAFIHQLQAQGRKVLMIGDGLNDAPALAAAHVSLSPITAADLTQAQADAVFLGDRLAPVLNAVVIARRARSLMLENLWLAAIYNAIAVPLAIIGVVTPLIAALAMSGSSILVTVNALRATRGGRR
jgi:Cu2+-exporting ATPase